MKRTNITLQDKAIVFLLWHLLFFIIGVLIFGSLVEKLIFRSMSETEDKIIYKDKRFQMLTQYLMMLQENNR